MTGIIWPLNLPQSPLTSGYTESTPSNLLRSETDTGPAKVRRRGGSKPITVNASYIMSTAETKILDKFVDESISEGAICFDWPRPKWLNIQGTNYVRARLVPQSDALYTRSNVDETTDFWKIQLQLEIFPKVPITSA